MASVETGSGTESIEVKLRGDSAYPSTISSGNAAGNMFTSAGVDSDTNDDLMWTPRSTSTTASLNDLDWTNGYEVPGLPGNDMSAETLTSAN